MEVVMALIVVAFFGLGYLFEKATGFIKQLKTSGSAKLSRGFKAEVSVVPINEKIEVCAPKTNFNSNDTVE